MVVYLNVVFPIILEKQRYRCIGLEIMGIHVAPDVCHSVDCGLTHQVFPGDTVGQELKDNVFQHRAVRCRIRPYQRPHEGFLGALQEIIEIDLISVELTYVLSFQELFEVLVLDDTVYTFLVVFKVLVLDTVICGKKYSLPGLPVAHLTVSVAHACYRFEAVTGFFY